MVGTTTNWFDHMGVTPRVAMAYKSWPLAPASPAFPAFPPRFMGGRKETGRLYLSRGPPPPKMGVPEERSFSGPPIIGWGGHIGYSNRVKTPAPRLDFISPTKLSTERPFL